MTTRGNDGGRVRRVQELRRSNAALADRVSDVDLMKAALRAHFG